MPCFTHMEIQSTSESSFTSFPLFSLNNNYRFLRGWWLWRFEGKVHEGNVQWHLVLQQFLWSTEGGFIHYAAWSCQLWYAVGWFPLWANNSLNLVLVCRSGDNTAGCTITLWLLILNIFGVNSRFHPIQVKGPVISKEKIIDISQTHGWIALSLMLKMNYLVSNISNNFTTQTSFMMVLCAPFVGRDIL